MCSVMVFLVMFGCVVSVSKSVVMIWFSNMIFWKVGGWLCDGDVFGLLCVIVGGMDGIGEDMLIYFMI